ncbi:MAG: amino acid racemase [Clostridia bacterium]|nr:amino acid racemase [Clostridia bacterium]
MDKKTLGILGGMGPAASAHFYTLLTQLTKAEHDFEHMKIILCSAPNIPDRTEYILRNSADNPLHEMEQAAKTLVRAGAELIAVPCNTAEYFHTDLQKLCPVPILRTVHETCAYAAASGVQKLGIMATNGTVKAEIYQKELLAFGIDFAVPSEHGQNLLHNIIYNGIKKARCFEKAVFFAVADELRSQGCDAIALGCTELSLISPNEKARDYNFIDSLEVLAKRSIQLCGYELREK